MRAVGVPKRPGPPDLSSDEYDSARKLIEELKRLYGRMSECLNDVERRDGIFSDILEKQEQITQIVRHGNHTHRNLRDR
jgi:hypothetical protein